LLREIGSTAYSREDVNEIAQAYLFQQMDRLDQCHIQLELLITRPAEAAFGLPEMVKQEQQLFLRNGIPKLRLRGGLLRRMDFAN
jgi:hypothetical protein